MGFGALGISTSLDSALRAMRWRRPLPIQKRVIPLVLQGKDVIACSRTGTGKTGAYLLPLISKLGTHSRTVGTRVLALVPTRELALQVSSSIKTLVRGTDLVHCVIIGGHDYEGQFEALAANPDIVVATPGRLLELASQTEFSFKRIEALVFDEADALFDKSHRLHVEELLALIGRNCQTLLFSATMPESLREFSKAGLRDYTFVRIDAEHSLAPELRLDCLLARPEHKLALSSALLERVLELPGQAIFFASTRWWVDLLERVWGTHCRHPCAFLTGRMDIEHRENQLGAFRRGELRVLVVTDLCARGVDLPEVRTVVSIDFPASAKIFIHRCGRTARRGRDGRAFLLATRAELPHLFGVAAAAGREVRGDDGEAGECVHVGRVAEDCLQAIQERLEGWKRFDEQLVSLSEVALKSMDKFGRTRGGCAAVHHAAAKAFPEPSYHSLFPPLCPAFDSLVQRVDAFRPKESLFALKVLNKLPNAPALRTFIANANAERDFRSKRASVAAPNTAISAAPNLPNANEYKSAAFYVSNEENVDKVRGLLDQNKLGGVDCSTHLLAEDANDLFKQQKRVWDAKRKRFKGQLVDARGEDVERLAHRKRAMNEKMSGLRKKFNSWKRSGRVRLQAEGAEEDAQAAERARGLFEERKRQRFRQVKPRVEASNRAKSVGEIVKARKKIAKGKVMQMEKGKRRQIEQRQKNGIKTQKREIRGKAKFAKKNFKRKF